jgi:outer membrane lipoprotein-sorting protein
MTATKRSQDMQCVILYIEKGSFRPLKLSMVQRGSKDAVIVFINSYQTGKNYDDSLFVFDKQAYPTAEIVDLR